MAVLPNVDANMDALVESTVVAFVDPTVVDRPEGNLGRGVLVTGRVRVVKPKAAVVGDF